MTLAKMRHKRRISELAMLAVSLLAVGAVPALGGTLDEALVLAYGSNPNLEAARAELRAVDEGVPQALSGWRPTVRLEGSTGRELRSTSTSASATRHDTLSPLSASLRLSQPLYRGGQTVASTSQAENLVLAQRAHLASVEQSILLRTVETYANVVRDQAVLELTKNNENVLTQQLTATNDRFAVGEVTRTDVAQSESRLARSRAQRIQAEGDLISSRAAYLEVVGDAPTDLQPPQLPAGLPSAEAETVEGTENHPDVVSARFVERAALDEVDVAFGQMLPSLTLNGRLTSQEDVTSANLSSNSAALTADLIVPLYQGGGVEARIREAKERVAQRRRETESQRRAASQEGVGAWQALETARARIVSLEAAVEATTVALEGVRQEASVGSRTVLDVLDAEQENLDAKVSLVRARRDELLASYRVLAAIGRLAADQLGLSVDIYDVSKHYQDVRDKAWGLGPSLE